MSLPMPERTRSLRTSLLRLIGWTARTWTILHISHRLPPRKPSLRGPGIMESQCASMMGRSGTTWTTIPPEAAPSDIAPFGRMATSSKTPGFKRTIPTSSLSSGQGCSIMERMFIGSLREPAGGPKRLDIVSQSETPKSRAVGLPNSRSSCTNSDTMSWAVLLVTRRKSLVFGSVLVVLVLISVFVVVARMGPPPPRIVDGYEVVMFDLRTGRETLVIGGLDLAGAARFMPDRSVVMHAQINGTLGIWHVAPARSPTLLWEGIVGAPSPSSDGSRIVFGEHPGGLRILDVGSGTSEAYTREGL